MLIDRQKQLLSILIKDKKWHTFFNIAQKLNCSTKTIQRDVLIIKELLPLKWNLKTSKGKGIILYKPADCSCAELNYLFIRNDLTFKIIDMLFWENEVSISFLCDKLYISHSYVYPHLKKVECYLDQFKLSLKRKPVKIYGNMVHIIFMYQNFYIHSYGDHEWPFHSYSKKEVHFYIDAIEEKLGIKLYPLDYRKLAYLIPILLEGKKRNKLISLENTLLNRTIDTPFYLKIWNLNETNFNCFFNREEIILILICINCSKYTHQNLLTYKIDVLQHFKSEDIRILKNIKKLILTLENTFECDFMNNQEFIFCVIQYFKQRLSKHYFLPHINFPEDETIRHIKNMHYKTFCKVQNIYKEWVEKYSINTLVSDEEISTLTLYVEGASMLEHVLEVKVLLLIEDTKKWELYIKGILISQFGSIFNFVDADIKNVHQYDYSQLNVDLILTTFTSVQARIPIIRISTCLTHRDLHEIKDFIYKNSFINNEK
ncbi:helix-turn-helix domain containing protein [Bacillus wiedmannii]|uniref:helix-turn-helix domain-containing protein n=1 Tax=Bacillus wiedmannii TaxID=1890302 RepID=UPI000BED9A02|nr:helix-turn-helix domain containing protein [Bacillus wiedmannii]PEF34285.1 capsule biosynthesis protein [Bacillus wiedmannii]